MLPSTALVTQSLFVQLRYSREKDSVDLAKFVRTSNVLRDVAQAALMGREKVLLESWLKFAAESC